MNFVNNLAAELSALEAANKRLNLNDFPNINGYVISENKNEYVLNFTEAKRLIRLNKTAIDERISIGDYGTVTFIVYLMLKNVL